MSTGQLEGKVAIATGARIAKRYAREDTLVVIAGLNEAIGQQTQGKIRVNAIGPASLVTVMNQGSADPFVVEPWLKWSPVGRFGQPIDVTGVAVPLAAADATFVAGAAFDVDGGVRRGGAPNWMELFNQVRVLRAAEAQATTAGGAIQ